MTAVEWLFDKTKSHFEHDGDLFEDMVFAYAIAKQKEREQHGRTWDAAIQAHESRGHNQARSLCDFDNYKVK